MAVLTVPPQISFSDYALEVRDMIDYGLSLADVEHAMADAALSEDSKAALWLLAWSDLSRDRRRGTDLPPTGAPALAAAGGRVVPLRRG